MSELIVKDNALIQASYTLDTVEQRLILLAIAEARETGHGITENSLLEVHASSYINTFNVEKHTAYTVLREASKSLFDRSHTMTLILRQVRIVAFIVVGSTKLGMNLNQELFSYDSPKILFHS
jgi:plasmid replication initiation protein